MSVVDFYDQLCPFYHLIYPDWEASIQRQAVQIDAVVREVWGTQVRSILDATCGIGTQAIGLSQLGYSVSASDISPRPVQRAKQEAEERGLSIAFGVADLRTLSSSYREPFDLVIACDNSIPHLLSDEEIREAFEEMYRCTTSGGGVLISVRDYDSSKGAGAEVVPYGLRTDGGRRFLVFQVWEFHGSIYDLSMYFVEDDGQSKCAVHIMRSKYYAVPVARLVELMTEAGFRDVRRFDDRFFQPLIVGSKVG